MCRIYIIAGGTVAIQVATMVAGTIVANRFNIVGIGVPVAIVCVGSTVLLYFLGTRRAGEVQSWVITIGVPLSSIAIFLALAKHVFHWPGFFY